MLNKLSKIILHALPVVIMIGLIPVFKNDFVLTGIYVLIIIISFAINYERKEYIFFIFGFVAMFISEFIFISTGVESFERISLFGIMPLWLPFLWAYAFVAIKRSIITILYENKISSETFGNEISMCRKLFQEKKSCAWGTCESCGVIPLLYKLHKNIFIEKKEEIDKIKNENLSK